MYFNLPFPQNPVVGLLAIMAIKGAGPGNQGDRSRDSLKMSDHGPVPLIALLIAKTPVAVVTTGGRFSLL